MSEKSPSNDEALEALDFIVNVLKEHEKDLDKPVNELGAVAGQLGETGELNGKVRKIEDKLNSLQGDVGNLLKSVSNALREPVAPVATVATMPVATLTPVKVPKLEPKPEPSSMNDAVSMPLRLQCKQWEDFQAYAVQAQTVSFVLKEVEKAFEVTALKGNQVVTYKGETPKLPFLLKTYLCKQLGVSEKLVVEGELALG